MEPPTLDLGDSLDERCGEIFVSLQGNILFVCSVCDEKLEGFKKFLYHIKEHYYESLDVEKALLTEYDSETTIINEGLKESNTVKIESMTDEANFEILHFDIKPEEEEIVSSPTSNEDPISHKDIESIISAEKTQDNNLTKTKEKPIATIMANSNKSKRRRLPLDSDERKFKCEKCDFGFRDKSNLAAHMRRHSDEQKRFKCSHCSKRFHSRTEVRTHTRSHTKERPFLCTDCGRTFVTSGALASHTKRHKNLRESQCPVCEKRFFDSGLLRDHMLAHTGERAHKCSQCDVSFSRLKALRCHQKLHENKREYECKLCPARFNQKPGLYSHMKSKHKTA